MPTTCRAEKPAGGKPRATAAPHARSASPLRFHARSVRSAASPASGGRRGLAHLPLNTTRIPPMSAQMATTTATMRGRYDVGNGSSRRMARSFFCHCQ